MSVTRTRPRINGKALGPDYLSRHGPTALARWPPEERSLLAHPARSVYGRFLAYFARTGLFGKGSNGSMHEVAALQPAARDASEAAGDNLRSQ